MVGWLALGQHLTPVQLLGALVILAALVIAQTQPRRKAGLPGAELPEVDFADAEPVQEQRPHSTVS